MSWFDCSSRTLGLRSSLRFFLPHNHFCISSVFDSSLVKYTSNRPNKRAYSSVRSVFLSWIASNPSAIRLYDTWTESKPFCHSKLSVLRSIPAHSLDFAWSLILSDFWHPPTLLTRSIQGSLTCGQLEFLGGRWFDFSYRSHTHCTFSSSSSSWNSSEKTRLFLDLPIIFLPTSLSADRQWSMSILYSRPDICTPLNVLSPL